MPSFGYGVGPGWPNSRSVFVSFSQNSSSGVAVADQHQAAGRELLADHPAARAPRASGAAWSG